MTEPHVPSVSTIRKIFRAATLAPRAGLSLGTLLIAAAVIMLLRNFGTGINSPSIPDPTARTDNQLPDDQPPDYQPPVARSLDAPQTQKTPTPTASPLITILIDERSYRLQISADPKPVYREISLENIKPLAANTTGDSNGIRVRILRRETSRQSAETQLLETLDSAGITPDAILMPSTPVP
jgi:hypothetical protein